MGAIYSRSNVVILFVALLSTCVFSSIISAPALAAAPLSANFTFTPSTGNNSTVFEFDASSSTNLNGTFSDLSFRWDWNNDSVFDTSWSNSSTANHTFASGGVYHVVLQIKNATSTTANVSKLVVVDSTPPFASLLLSDGSSFKEGSTVPPGHASIVCVAIEDVSKIKSIQYSLDAQPYKSVNVSSDSDRTTISFTNLAEGDHYIIIVVNNSVNLSTVLGVSFKASAMTPNQPLDPIWNIVAIVVVVVGLLASAVLIWRKWKKSPPAKIELQEPGLPPVM